MAPFSVQIFNNIAQEGLSLLDDRGYKQTENPLEADAILLRSQNLHNVTLAKNIKAVARAGAGTNNVPVDKLTEYGIVVFNTPGANANAVKELVISCFVMASRNLFPAIDYVRELDAHGLSNLEQVKKQFKGFELKDKTLAIIGLGAIGCQVANSAIDLGMKVKGFDPKLTIERALSLSSKVHAAGTVEECIQDADLITIHVPLLKETEHLINTDTIAKMKPQATVLNFARGELVNPSAIKEALKAGKISSYISDFPEATLLNTPNCYFLPHLGASTNESEVNCAVQAIEQLQTFLETGQIKNSVNFPNIALRPNQNNYRLFIANKNVPGALSDIMQRLAEDRLNIVDMINQSLKEVAVTLIDVDKTINPSIIESIQSLPSVLRAYAIPREA